MSIQVNRSTSAAAGDADNALEMPVGMRQMQAAPEAILEDDENDILIIPMVAIREGVFQAATSPVKELYLAEHFGRQPDSWNDRMVTIGHPKSGRRFISAGSNGVWERDGIGRIRNARVDNKKLKVEAHIDMVKVAELGSEAIDLVEQVRNGEQIDVSIGAFVDSVSQFGAHGGDRYEAVQVNYVPDHVAILPAGTKGACTWEDGCGAPRVNHRCQCAPGTDCQCSDAPELTDAQLGDMTKRDMLNTAIAEKQAGYFFIVQVFDDHVVYRNDREQLISRDFSIDEETGTVTLSDEAVEGTLVSEFMPITVQEEVNMERNGAVSQLITAEQSPWAETDRAFLMGVDDAQFTKLTVNEDAAGETTPASGATASQGATGNDPDPEPDPEPVAQALQAAETGATAAAEPVTLESYIAAAPGRIGEVLGEGLATLQQERTRLIGGLTANKACPFTEAQLQAKNTGELRQLVQLAGTDQQQAPDRASSYAGQTPLAANYGGVKLYADRPAEPDWNNGKAH